MAHKYADKREFLNEFSCQQNERANAVVDEIESFLYFLLSLKLFDAFENLRKRCSTAWTLE